MVSRTERIGYRVETAGRTRTRATPRLSRKQRFLFVVALFTFGIASFYTSIAALTRVTPALVKGRDISSIPVVNRAAELIPPAVRPSSPGPTSSFNRRINLLVIGVDKRPRNDEDQAQLTSERNVPSDLAPYNTDTIMVVSLDPVSKTMSTLSIPRDLWVDVHINKNFVTEERINASYGIGFRAGNTIEAGAKQLSTDIEENFGVRIDYWVWMDFRGVENLIDAIGGVVLDIPPDLAVDEDWWYTDDDVTNPHIETFPAGRVSLNGYRAVAYGRYRNDSDLNRVKRQQIVLQAALSQSLSRGLLNADISALWDTYNHYVHHNVPIARAGGMLPLLKDTGGQMQTYSLGDPVNGIDTTYAFTTEGGAAVLGWHPENVRYIVNQAFPRVTYAKSIVEIQNGFGPDGADRMRALGTYLKYVRFLPTVQLGLDVAKQPGTTIVLYTESRRSMAEDIAGWLGVPESAIKEEPRTLDTQPDIVITIGADFKLPQ